METNTRDRWTFDRPGDDFHDGGHQTKKARAAINRLGSHAAGRYRRFRRSTEELKAEKVDQELFGLLLSAESIREDIRIFEAKKSPLVRLSQTGSFVRQLRRLHGVLDAAAAAYPLEFDETPDWRNWEDALSEERRVQADWYRQELEVVNSGETSPILDEIVSDGKAEEILTLLMAAVDKYGPDAGKNMAAGEESGSKLIVEELDVIKLAFNMVATHSNVIVMTLPTWFVLPFEFGSMFGLSTWGNERFVPEHKDKERFIREASGWSELHHPHVAKFLGACHVGDEMFVVHEKVRSMTEYAAVVEGERKKVWERIYEVGLALQYMRECGYACPDVILENLYCAQYEDRAVMFDVHLRDYDAVSDVESCQQIENNRQTLFGISSLEALVIAIVKLFESMHKASKNGLPYQDTAKSTEEQRAVTSFPTTKPSCLEDREWDLLRKLMENVDFEFLQVIDTLGNLAGVHERPEWLEFVPTLERQIEMPTQVKDMKATLIGETIEQVLSACRKTMPISEKSPIRLLTRFDDICDQLEQRRNGMDDWSTLLEPIAHLCGLLRQFSNFAAQNAPRSKVSLSWTDSASASVAFSQRVMQQLDPGRVYSMHLKMDQLIALHGLSSSDESHNWFPEWQIVYQSEPPNEVTDTDLTGSPSLPPWFIPREQIDFEAYDAFSEGAFGSVHKGKWFQTPVIVKRVKQQNEASEAQFRQEAEVWFQLNHINVVKMYGACDVGDLFFVCEYASGGDLDKYLISKGRDPYLIWYCLLNAALGLQYLHNNGIVHADLKANNILVGGDGVAKLTDFGLSVRAKDPSGATAGALGAYQWKAPECLSGSVATFASDVYSFAMVIIEAMSGSCPWGNHTDDIFVKHKVKKGCLPPRPSNMEEPEWQLIERMCVKDPHERVTMDVVVTQLSSLLQRLDQDHLWRGGVYNPKTFKNHVVSRDGILLSLINLSESKNEAIVVHAANLIVSVELSRDGPSSQLELDAVLDMLFYGSDRQKSLAANAVSALAIAKRPALTSKRVISALLTMVTSGTTEQKTTGVNALSNMSAHCDISESVMLSHGISALLRLIREGTDIQKLPATTTLANLSNHADISDPMLALHGITMLVQLVREGTNDLKHTAAMTLANMLFRADISESVLSSNGIEALLLLIRDGTDDHKKQAAWAFANLSGRTNISASVLPLNGIEALLRLMRDGTDDQKMYAVWTLANLSSDVDISESVMSLNGIETLLRLVREGTDDQKQQATTTLVNLSGRVDISKSVLSLNGIEALLRLVRDGTEDQKYAASMALANLILRADISESLLSLHGVEPLFLLVRDGTEEQKYAAARTLANLSCRADISESVLSMNGVETLFQLLRHGTDEQKNQAARILANLSADADINEAVVSLNGIEALLRLVRDGTDDQKKQAALTLANLSTRADISESVLAVKGVDTLLHLFRTGTDDQKYAAARVLDNLSKQLDIDAGPSCCMPRRCMVM